ncbi:MAG: phosphoribosylglycinamide formyltransferase [Cyclobacteriaceae bacterium]
MEEGSISIAIFASGSGSNAENIARYFDKHRQIKVSEILSNKADAYVLKRADKLGIRSSTFNREEFTTPSFLERLQNFDYIILAGFLWLVPEFLIRAFPDKIINIHPALLPNYGGKGMYGSKVHEAVVAAKEEESGITIHLINEEYDKGEILFQRKCRVEEDETPDSLASKIHALEHEHFPRVIEQYILQ